MSNPLQNRRAAFSLVEVVLALGIMAFGLVPLMALLPIGLKMHRQAIDTTVSSQIVARVAQEAQQTDYSNLPDGGSQPLTYCFDDQGNLLATGNSRSLFASCKDPKRIYDVQATVNKIADLPGSGAATRSPSLARIQIDIAPNKAADPSVFTSGNPVPVFTYFSLLSKND